MGFLCKASFKGSFWGSFRGSFVRPPLKDVLGFFSGFLCKASFKGCFGVLFGVPVKASFKVSFGVVFGVLFISTPPLKDLSGFLTFLSGSCKGPCSLRSSVWFGVVCLGLRSLGFRMLWALGFL